MLTNMDAAAPVYNDLIGQTRGATQLRKMLTVGEYLNAASRIPKALKRCIRGLVGGMDSLVKIIRKMQEEATEVVDDSEVELVEESQG